MSNVSWQPDEWHAAWFTRACQNRVNESLASLRKELNRRAVSFEMKHLENPHLSLESIVAANGILPIAVNLDRAKRNADSAAAQLPAAQLFAESNSLQTAARRVINPEPPETPRADPSLEVPPTSASRIAAAPDDFSFFSEPRPLGGNPYSPADKQWHAFEAATFDAKERLDTVWFRYQQRFPATTSHSEVLALILQFRLERLDVRADVMLQTVVADEGNAPAYEDWVEAMMQDERKDVLNLVHVERTHYSPFFDEDKFVHELVLRQQEFKRRCDSRCASLIRQRMALNGEGTEAPKIQLTEQSTERPELATEKPSPAGSGPDETLAPDRKRARAATVGKLVKELGALRRYMIEDATEYAKLAAEHKDYLTFEIAAKDSALKAKLLVMQASRRHVWLAIEFASVHYGLSTATIEDDWKHHKPVEFRRQK